MEDSAGESVMAIATMASAAWQRNRSNNRQERRKKSDNTIGRSGGGEGGADLSSEACKR